jgi:hypothetical protein
MCKLLLEITSKYSYKAYALLEGCCVYFWCSMLYSWFYNSNVMCISIMCRRVLEHKRAAVIRFLCQVLFSWKDWGTVVTCKVWMQSDILESRYCSIRRILTEIKLALLKQSCELCLSVLSKSCELCAGLSEWPAVPTPRLIRRIIIIQFQPSFVSGVCLIW